MLQAAAAAAAGVGVPSTGIQWGVLWRAAQHLSQNLRSEVQIREIPNLLTQSSSSCQQLHPFLPSQLTSISPYSSTSKTSVHEPVNAEFTYACKQLKTAATQDTTWDRRIHDAVAHINQQLGGFWLLVECGAFPDNHSLAGRPARALLHASMWCVQQYEVSDISATALSDSVSTSSTSSSSGTSSSLDSNTSSSSASSSSRPRGRPPGPNSKRKVAFDLKLLKAPVKHGDMPGLSEFQVHYAAYQLDAEGWPTGRMYSSASHFEHLTTCAHHHKPESSFKLVCDGQTTSSSLKMWVKHHLGSGTLYKLSKSSKRAGFHIGAAYRSMVQALGVVVEDASDAASAAVKGKKGRLVPPASS